jgi:hypothetical protein
MHPALQPMLRRFETAVLVDPAVLGVLYTGSLGRGTADRFSDLDIDVWLAEDAFAEVAAKTRELLSTLGTIQWSQSLGPGFARALVGREWRSVDLGLHRRDDAESGPKIAGARVVKDFDGVLSGLVAASRPEDVTPTWEEARVQILAAPDCQIYIAAHNARGAIWSAMGEVTYQLALLYEILARLRGRRSYGFRYVEHLLTPAERDLLAATWPTAPTRDEVRRAARALWAWSRHVRDEVERGLGVSLDVTVDEADLLAAVDAIYDVE